MTCSRSFRQFSLCCSVINFRSKLHDPIDISTSSILTVHNTKFAFTVSKKRFPPTALVFQSHIFKGFFQSSKIFIDCKRTAAFSYGRPLWLVIFLRINCSVFKAQKPIFAGDTVFKRGFEFAAFYKQHNQFQSLISGHSKTICLHCQQDVFLFRFKAVFLSNHHVFLSNGPLLCSTVFCIFC